MALFAWIEEVKILFKLVIRNMKGYGHLSFKKSVLCSCFRPVLSFSPFCLTGSFSVLWYQQTLCAGQCKLGAGGNGEPANKCFLEEVLLAVRVKWPSSCSLRLSYVNHGTEPCAALIWLKYHFWICMTGCAVTGCAVTHVEWWDGVIFEVNIGTQCCGLWLEVQPIANRI